MQVRTNVFSMLVLLGDCDREMKLLTKTCPVEDLGPTPPVATCFANIANPHHQLPVLYSNQTTDAHPDSPIVENAGTSGAFSNRVRQPRPGGRANHGPRKFPGRAAAPWRDTFAISSLCLTLLVYLAFSIKASPWGCTSGRTRAVRTGPLEEHAATLLTMPERYTWLEYRCLCRDLDSLRRLVA
jgi:hypothetical protein